MGGLLVNNPFNAASAAYGYVGNVTAVTIFSCSVCSAQDKVSVSKSFGLDPMGVLARALLLAGPDSLLQAGVSCERVK